MLIRSCPPLRHPDADPALPPDPPDVESPRRWWLVQSHPQQERKLAAELVAAGIAAYLPLGVRRWVSAGGHRQRRTTALFPGYLFVLAAGPFPRPPMQAQARIARVRVIDEQERFRRELAALHAMFSAPGDVQLGPVIAAQSRVRIASGLYRGLEGVVRALGNGERVYVNLHEVGMSASVEFDLAQLEAVR